MSGTTLARHLARGDRSSLAAGILLLAAAPDFDMNRMNRHLLSSFERIRDPLLIVDTDGVVRVTNPAAREVLDVEDGRNITEVAWIDRRISFDGRSLLALIKNPSPVLGLRLEDSEGNDSGVVLDIIDLSIRKNRSRFRLIHIRDFSPFKSYERWKDELVSTVAHEIRNPLTAMRNAMDMLVSQTSDANPDGQRSLLGVSIRSIDRLTRLLDNVLDVSRIGSGSYTPEPTWVDVREFTGEVVETFKTLFNVRRQRLEYKVSERLARIYVDVAKLEQILINLLNNAVKFTPDGGSVEVSVHPASLETLGDDLRILPWGDLAPLEFVRFSVRDTGIGMGGETLSHLFTRFYRDNGKGGQLGSHLGLSISKTLVEVQNGSLDIESELGVGTRVNVSLPADEKTFTLIGRVRSIERVLARLVGSRCDLMLRVVRKGESPSWRTVFEGWGSPPVFNPVMESEKSGAFFAWTLGEHLALAFLPCASDAPSASDRPGSSPEVPCGESHQGEGCVTTSYRLSTADSCLSRVLGLALKPAHEQTGDRPLNQYGPDIRCGEAVGSIQFFDQESADGKRQNTAG